MTNVISLTIQSFFSMTIRIDFTSKYMQKTIQNNKILKMCKKITTGLEVISINTTPHAKFHICKYDWFILILQTAEQFFLLEIVPVAWCKYNNINIKFKMYFQKNSDNEMQENGEDWKLTFK